MIEHIQYIKYIKNLAEKFKFPMVIDILQHYLFLYDGVVVSFQ